MDQESGKSFGLKSAGRLSPAFFGYCPTHWLIRQLSDRWTVQVLSALEAQPLRFSELREGLSPVSPKMLDLTLKKLIRIGLVRRSAYGLSSQVRYDLTDLGRSVRKPFGRILWWSQQHLDRVRAAKATALQNEQG